MTGCSLLEFATPYTDMQKIVFLELIFSYSTFKGSIRCNAHVFRRIVFLNDTGILIQNPILHINDTNN